MTSAWRTLRQVELWLADVRGDARAVLSRSGLPAVIGESHIDRRLEDVPLPTVGAE